MNKGIITKVSINKDQVKYNIRLDRNVKIPEGDKGEVEYNIYVDPETTKAYLFKSSTDLQFGFSGIVVVNIGCKCEFELKITENKDGSIKDIAIEKISYEQ